MSKELRFKDIVNLGFLFLLLALSPVIVLGAEAREKVMTGATTLVSLVGLSYALAMVIF